MGYAGAKKFHAVCKDLKPAVAQKVQPVLKKCEGLVVPKGKPAAASEDVVMAEEPKNPASAKPGGVPSKAGVTGKAPATSQPKPVESKTAQRPGTALAAQKPGGAPVGLKRPGTAAPATKLQSKEAPAAGLSIKAGNKN